MFSPFSRWQSQSAVIGVILAMAMMPDVHVAGVHAATAEDDSLAAVTAALEGSSRAYLELRHLYWDPGEAIAMRAIISPVAGADLAAGRLKGNWDKMAAALGVRSRKEAMYRAVAMVFDDSGKQVLWTGELPIDPKPLADAARALVPDETIFSRMDPPAVLAFRIPGERLKAGQSYRATLSFRDPDGKVHPFDDGSTMETGVRFTLRNTRLDLQQLRLPARVEDAAELLTRAVEIANPGKRRFPNDDPNDCQARSVWCLRTFLGRVYVGFGDWAKNRGPIPLWSFAPDDDPALAARYGRYSFTAGESPRLLFTQEYVVQEHSIERYHVWGDRLVVPGIDGLKNAGPDGIAFANIYIREKGHWRKLSTLPRTVHVLDAVGAGDRLFATVDRIGDSPESIVVSDDVGLSWKVRAPGGGELAILQRGLLALSGTQAILHADDTSTIHRREYAPGFELNGVHRVTPYRNGVVYTTWDSWGRSRSAQHPLFFLEQPDAGPRLIGPFYDGNVRDLFVDRGELFVLTGRRIADDHFEGEVHSCRDFTNWVRQAAFRVPAMPNALAALDGTFYIGLVNRGFNAQTYDHLKPTQYEYADAASGGIFRLTR